MRAQSNVVNIAPPVPPVPHVPPKRNQARRDHPDVPPLKLPTLKTRERPHESSQPAQNPANGNAGQKVARALDAMRADVHAQMDRLRRDQSSLTAILLDVLAEQEVAQAERKSASNAHPDAATAAILSKLDRVAESVAEWKTRLDGLEARQDLLEASTSSEAESVPALRSMQRQLARIETKYIPDIHRDIERIEGVSQWSYASVLCDYLPIRAQPNRFSDTVDAAARGDTLVVTQNTREGPDGLWIQVRTPKNPSAEVWALAESEDSSTPNIGAYRMRL